MNFCAKLVEKIRAIVCVTVGCGTRHVPPSIKSALAELGFVPGQQWNDCRHVFYNRERGLVLKMSYVVDKTPPRAIPTLEVYVPDFDRNSRWLLQAMAEKIVGNMECYSDTRRTLANIPRHVQVRHFGYDVHDNNLATFEGRVVAIDW